MGRKGGDRILVTGYAQAPRGTCLEKDTAGVVLEVDPTTHTITDAEFIMVTELARRFCKELVVGYPLAEGVDPLLEEMGQVLLIPAQQAYLKAFRSAVRRYWERVGRQTPMVGGTPMTA